jgi:hypothetical protein
MSHGDVHLLLSNVILNDGTNDKLVSHAISDMDLHILMDDSKMHMVPALLAHLSNDAWKL